MGLGHVRLSILDLTDAANQPFHSEGGSYVLVFNGEVYNHNDLRRELVSHGRIFRTRSDTEVLLAAYEVWGEKFLDKLEGMFAFALLDNRKQILLLARDALGIKPLYFMENGREREFLFASEIRGLKALRTSSLMPDRSAFAEFLLNGFLYEPRTGFEGVRKLAPGEALELNLRSGESRLWTYYDPLSSRPTRDLRSLIDDSMRLQSLADVKVGLFFSGGLDSSILAASDQRLQGLRVVYSQTGIGTGSDDTFADNVAAQLNLNVENVNFAPGVEDSETILNKFRDVARGTEEPISDYTYKASELICEIARQQGFKVMLSGMGGDELFAGYPRYTAVAKRRLFRLVGPLICMATPALKRLSYLAKKADRLTRFATTADFGMAYTNLLGYFNRNEVNLMLGDVDGIHAFENRISELLARVQGYSPLKQAMYLDRFGYLAHNLVVTDKSSMAKGVEVRVPLITRDLAYLGFSMRDSALISWKDTKRPLRHLLAARIPRKLVHRPKEGFNPPLDDEIYSLGADRLLSQLTGRSLLSVVDPQFIRRIVAEHFRHTANHTYRIWQLLYFSFWLEEASSHD